MDSQISLVIFNKTPWDAQQKSAPPWHMWLQPACPRRCPATATVCWLHRGLWGYESIWNWFWVVPKHRILEGYYKYYITTKYITKNYQFPTVYWKTVEKVLHRFVHNQHTMKASRLDRSMSGCEAQTSPTNEAHPTDSAALTWLQNNAEILIESTTPRNYWATGVRWYHSNVFLIPQDFCPQVAITWLFKHLNLWRRSYPSHHLQFIGPFRQD